MNLDQSLIKEYWHLICHRQELPSPGDYFKFSTAVGDIVVFNDGADLVAFDNHCPHRGAIMFDGAHGNQPATCKYHGWTWSAGRVIVPHPEAFAGCDVGKAQLFRFKLDWCGDFVFVAMEPRLSLYEQLGGVAEILENISFNVSSLMDVNQYPYECGWQIAVENALEPYHISMVHPTTLASLELEEGQNEFFGLNSVWYAPIANKSLHRKLERLKRFFFVDFAYDGYMSIYLFPFVMISSTFGYSYSVQHFFPTQDGATLFSSRLLRAHLADAKSEQLLGSFFDSTAQMNRKVFEEDHEICRRVPSRTWSPAPLKFPAKSEVKIDHFRLSCREHLAHEAARATHGSPVPSMA